MTDVTETPAPAADNASPVMTFEVPGIEGKHTFDCSTIPANIRLDFLKDKTRAYIVNRVNAVQQRWNKLPAVVAWAAYENAIKADPLQTLVAKPEGDKPGPADLTKALNEALKALTEGNVRKQGEAKPRKTVDPLTKLVTTSVVRDVFESKKGTTIDGKPYTFPHAVKEVGGDGIAYLNALVEAKVAEGGDRAALEKARDAKYIAPAKLYLAGPSDKKLGELPALL